MGDQKNLWRTSRAELLDGLYPPTCQLCGDVAVDGLACAKHVVRVEASVARCGLCFRRLPRAVAGAGLPRPPWLRHVAKRYTDWSRCRHCRAGTPGLGRLLALGDYPGDLRPWVLAFKHAGRVDLARPLAGLLAQRCVSAGWDFMGVDERSPELQRPVLVPVPLAPSRKFERGYDQADALARALGIELGFGVARRLARTRVTAPQGEPGSRSRIANVSGAFAMARRVPFRNAKRLDPKQPILLIDDVVSSGATLAECARVLRAAGAKCVGALALARAERAS